MKKRILSLMLTLCMLLSVISTMGITASAENTGLPTVSYRKPVYVNNDPMQGVADWKDITVGGNSSVSYTLINADSADRVTLSTDGVYVVGADYNGDGEINADDASLGTNSFTYAKGLVIDAAVTLVLAVGFTLTVNGCGEANVICDDVDTLFAAGVVVNESKSLEICGQQNDIGSLAATGGIAISGLGVINGGDITAKGGNATTLCAGSGITLGKTTGDPIIIQSAKIYAEGGDGAYYAIQNTCTAATPNYSYTTVKYSAGSGIRINSQTCLDFQLIIEDSDITAIGGDDLNEIGKTIGYQNYVTTRASAVTEYG